MATQTPQKFDSQIDFLTEGYITQLAESTLVKCESITPHVFTYNLSKANGVVPVLATNFVARANSLYVGHVSFNKVTGAGIPVLTLDHNAVSSLVSESFTNELHVFSNIINPYNMALTNADTFRISLHFVGYLITTNG